MVDFTFYLYPVPAIIIANPVLTHAPNPSQPRVYSSSPTVTQSTPSPCRPLAHSMPAVERRGVFCCLSSRNLARGRKLPTKPPRLAGLLVSNDRAVSSNRLRYAMNDERFKLCSLEPHTNTQQHKEIKNTHSTFSLQVRRPHALHCLRGCYSTPGGITISKIDACVKIATINTALRIN